MFLSNLELTSVRTVAANLSQKVKDDIREASSGIAGSPANATMISIDKLHIPEYQRDAYGGALKKHLNNWNNTFDWDLFGVVTVAPIDGTDEYVILNGQHRTILAYVSKDFREVPVHIVTTRDQKKQAKLFWGMNGGTVKRISNEEQFTAEVHAEMPEAMDLRNVLIQSGLSCGKINVDPARAKVKRKSLEKAVNLGRSHVPTAVRLLRRNLWAKRWSDQVFVALIYALSTDTIDWTYKTLLSDFENWIDAKSSIEPTPLAIIDNSLKNASEWSVGLGYGIVRNFMAYQRASGRPSLPVEKLKKLYLSKVKGHTSDEVVDGDDQ